MIGMRPNHVFDEIVVRNRTEHYEKGTGAPGR